MTFTRFLIGIPLAVLALVPLALAARDVRRRLLPGWCGPDALVADVVLGLAGVVLAGELAGTVGLFGAPGVITACLLVAGVVAVVVRRRPRLPSTVDPAPVPAPVPQVPRWHLVVGAIALVPLLASWAARAMRSLGEGMYAADTLWYHLPAAASFLQTGRTTSIQFFEGGPVTAYFPLSSSLLHGVAMALFGSDALSTVANLGWLVLALLAAWCIGARFGVAVPSTLAVGLLFAGPVMTETQAGSALNDVSGVACLLAAVAIVGATAREDRTLGQDLVAGLALGLAIGMKLTFVAPAGLLAVALVATARPGRRVRTAALLGVASITGAYWFVRNLLATGNPIPTLEAGLGPLRLDAVSGAPDDPRSVSHYLFDGTAWDQYLAPGFEDALGRAWPALLALVLVGLVGGLLVPPTPRVRALAAVGLGSLVAFVYTPQAVDFLEGQPLFFPTNLRYAAPAFAIGLVLSPIVLHRAAAVLVPVLAGLLAVTQVDAVSWPVARDRASFFEDHIDGGSALAGLVAVLVAGLIVAGAVAIARRAPDGRWVVALPALFLAVFVVVVVAAAHPRYADHRYRRSPFMPELFRWARDRHDERIGTIGVLGQVQYPLTGSDLSNRVRFMAVETDDGGARPARSCEELMAVVERGRFDHVVLFGLEPVEWVRTQPDAVPVPEAAGYSPEGLLPPVPVQVFELDPSVTERRC